MTSTSLRGQLTSEGTHREAFSARDWQQLLFAGLLWGASFLFIASGLEHFGPGVVTFGRIFIGTLTLAFFPKARAVKIDRADWPRIVVVSVCWMAFPMTLFPLAQQHIASGLAGMLNGSIPMFAAIIASVALRRLPGPFQRLGLIIGALGIVLLGIPAVSDGRSSATAVVLVLIACASYGIAINANVPLAQKYGAVPAFWRCQIIASALTLPFGLWGLRTSTWNSQSALALIALGVFGTALAFLAMSDLSRRVGSTRSAALTYLEAIIALVLGVVVRHEKVRTLEVVGCAVVLVGAWLVSRSDS